MAHPRKLAAKQQHQRERTAASKTKGCHEALRNDANDLIARTEQEVEVAIAWKEGAEEEAGNFSIKRSVMGRSQWSDCEGPSNRPERYLESFVFWFFFARFSPWSEVS